MRRRLAWAAIVVIALLHFTGVTGGAESILFLYVPGLILLVLWATPLYTARLTWRNSAFWSGEQEYVFSRDGVSSSSSSGTASRTRWQAIMRTAETREFFLFFTSDQHAFFAPKRVLSASQIVDLRRLIADHAGKGDDLVEVLDALRSPPGVEVSFELDPAESARAGMAAARDEGSLWIWYLLMGLVVLWNTAPAAYREWRHGGLAAVSIPMLLLGVAPMAILAALLPSVARWVAKRQLRTGPSARGVQRIGVAEWGLQIVGPMHAGVLEWSSLIKARETPEFFFFFLSKVQAVFIPKRLLSAADLERVRVLARGGLGGNAELLGQ